MNIEFQKEALIAENLFIEIVQKRKESKQLYDQGFVIHRLQPLLDLVVDNIWCAWIIYICFQMILGIEDDPGGL